VPPRSLTLLRIRQAVLHDKGRELRLHCDSIHIIVESLEEKTKKFLGIMLPSPTENLSGK
jgi:hypothetical protein